MNGPGKLAALALLACLAALAPGRQLGFDEFRAVRDSLGGTAGVSIPA
jgi:hypothetical protein